MAVPAILNSFSAGEIAPSLFGRQDLSRYHSACGTMRNFFVSYRGPAYSRAGTRFCAYSKQTGRSVPPRLIPFEFSLSQGIALEFGNLYMRPFVNGAPVLESGHAITGVTKANPAVVSLGAPASFSTGDWIYFEGVGGMTQLNTRTYVITVLSSTTFSLADVFGNSIDSTSFTTYTSGGNAYRVYTLATPWAEADLLYIKPTQDADTMTLCCVNQATQTEYQSQNLTRAADDNWSLSAIVPAPSIAPPTGVAGSATTTGPVDYQYVVTAISIDGTESIASNIANIPNAIDIAALAGSLTIDWNPVAGAVGYNVYKATPSFTTVPDGAQFGYAAQSSGTQLIDPNITPDLQQVPPTHQDPFARGQILEALVTGGGSGASFTYTITTSTGSGVILTPIVVGSALSALLVADPGENYAPGDTISLSGGATATLTIGPQSGTYPSVPGYFQERRVFGNSLNNPDTYWMSQPGSFLNFDTRNPTIDSDAITGSPWATQVNGLQWLVQTNPGLLVMTGSFAWILSAPGSFATNTQAITPSSQDAIPQAFTGVSAIVPPFRVNYDVLYVDPKNCFVYDLPYQLYALSEPIDLTEISPHLFLDYSLSEVAWCAHPYKTGWFVRDDGVLLSLTYYKSQQISGWGRHDTAGFWESVCSVVENSIDALYLSAERFVGSATQAYTIERMDDRYWTDVESTWCVDCGLTLALPTPNATLGLTSALGAGTITGSTNLVGGAGYSSATTVTVVDQAVDKNGAPIGSGATVTPTIGGGAITALTISAAGSNYQQPMFVVSDPAGSAGGSGFSATPTLGNATTLGATASVFTGTVGQYVRAGGGIAVITAVASGTSATANVLSPFPTAPNSGGTPVTFAPGAWTMAAQVSTVTAPHLANQIVTGLADGNVIAPTQANASGTITLSTAASAVTVGLGFQCQLQTAPIDFGQPTVQGQRKKIAAVTLRMEASRGVKVGANQVDGSTLSPPQLAPIWDLLQLAPDTGPDAPNFPVVPYNALATPLRTGDVRVAVEGGWTTPGQICVQQDNPLPCQVLALIPEFEAGDVPQVQAKPRQQSKTLGAQR